MRAEAHAFHCLERKALNGSYGRDLKVEDVRQNVREASKVPSDHIQDLVVPGHSPLHQSAKEVIEDVLPHAVASYRRLVGRVVRHRLAAASRVHEWEPSTGADVGLACYHAFPVVWMIG